MTTFATLSTGALAVALISGCAGPHSGAAFSELRYPVAVRHLDVDGIKVAYAEAGPREAKESLLLIHGLGSYLPVWQKNIPALAGGRRVVAVDLPGYGKSDKGDYPYSMEFFAGVVDQVIGRLQLQRVTVVGHSMGGQIALTHALLRPGRARALVLLAPAGFEQFTAEEGARLESLTTKEIIMATPPAGVRANLAVNFVSMPADAAFMAEDRLRVIGGPDFPAYAHAVSRSVSAMVRGPVFSRLPELTLPVLVLFGQTDHLIPNPFLHRGSTEAVARRGVEQLRDGRLEIIERAGHMVQFERPEEVNRAILAFLDALPAPAVSAPQLK